MNYPEIEFFFMSADANSVELKMQKVVEAMMYVELENQTGQVYSETLKIDAPIWLGYGEHGDVVASQLELWPIAKPIRWPPFQQS